MTIECMLAEHAFYCFANRRKIPLPSIDNFIILSRLLHTTIEDILVIDEDIPRLWGILNRWLNDICRRFSW